jgi:DNA-binding NtrC family response regulator
MRAEISILYFDDEEMLLNIFRDMFGGEFVLLTASVPEEALQALSLCPDIIISDLSMPDISGIDFLREAESLCPGSFRVLLIGYGKLGDVIGEVSSGVIQMFIPKPWNEESMRRALERANAGKRNLRLKP